MEHNLSDLALINNLRNLELNQLFRLRDDMLVRASGWLSCQDGSYECALDSYGFNAVVREISARTGLVQS